MLPFYSPENIKKTLWFTDISSGMKKEKWRVNNKLWLR